MFVLWCRAACFERLSNRGKRKRKRNTHKKEGVWGTGQTGLPDRRAPVREREGDVYFFCFLLSYRSFLFSLSPLSAGFFLSPSPRQPVTRGLSVVYEWGIIGESLGVKAQRRRGFSCLPKLRGRPTRFSARSIRQRGVADVREIERER